MVEGFTYKIEPREWKTRSILPEYGSDSNENNKIKLLQAQTGLSPITLQVCLQRGLDSAQLIHDFLNPRIEALHSPFSIRDMELAVSRLVGVREKSERLRIFGDYDVDGTTGAALLFCVLREFGYKDVDVRQPDRFKDGYGLNVGAVEEAVADGVRLLLTVDCGITSFEAAKRARALGLELIVIDHHQVDPEHGIPEAVAVLNPQRKDCESGLKELCGCGLAFYLAIALRSKGREAGWFSGVAEPNLRQHLDLVVMATAADMVPLTGDNHILVRHGMGVLKQSKKAGVKALLEVAGLSTKEVSPGHLGFVLGPRINASGRIQSASLALELLVTQDPVRAMELARELERLNDERAKIQNQIWDEVKVRVERGIAEGRFRHGIVVADASWHEGVIGIVASRVTETFHKPAAVIAIRQDFGKGSVRSYGGKNVLDALRASSRFLRTFGGHHYAAGLSVAIDDIKAFEEAFDAALEAIAEDVEMRPLFIEGQCKIENLDIKTLGELERLGPFGPGNPEPVFAVRAEANSYRILKERHLKINLMSTDDEKTVPSYLEAIWFYAAERQDLMANLATKSGAFAEWAGVPELNRFNGKVTPTFRVKDWRLNPGC